jgi:hypothetical protein
METTQLKLGFGLNPVPAEAKAAHGVRYIYQRNQRTFKMMTEFVFNRQDCVGEHDARQIIISTLNSEEFKKDWEAKVAEGFFGRPESDKLSEYDFTLGDVTIHIRANPNTSCGYLYRTAWL